MGKKAIERVRDGLWADGAQNMLFRGVVVPSSDERRQV